MSERSSSSAMVWAIGPAFLCVAVWLWDDDSLGAGIPQTPAAVVAPEELRAGAVRKPLPDASLATVGGSAHQCSECHKLFAPSQDKHALMQHKDIQLKHGMNARCLNCHDGANRDMLVLHDGTLVTFGQAPRLCSQCHGTVYRDWQRGMHGKTMGSWDVTSGEQHRLACNECHNPHSPAYPPQRPLPGPHTLRMGDQSQGEEPEERHTPLRRWSQPLPEGERPQEKDPAGWTDPLDKGPGL